MWGKPYFYKYKMIKRILYTLLIMFPVVASAQINTDRVMAIGRNALYFEDYVLSTQYFNQVINAKPYLSDPYFYRGLAKINLDDFQGAESDCSEAIERNTFVVSYRDWETDLENLPKDIMTMHEKAEEAAETLEQLQKLQQTEQPKPEKLEEKKEEVKENEPKQ